MGREQSKAISQHVANQQALDKHMALRHKAWQEEGAGYIERDDYTCECGAHYDISAGICSMCWRKMKKCPVCCVPMLMHPTGNFYECPNHFAAEGHARCDQTIQVDPLPNQAPPRSYPVPFVGRAFVCRCGSTYDVLRLSVCPHCGLPENSITQKINANLEAGKRSYDLAHAAALMELALPTVPGPAGSTKAEQLAAVVDAALLPNWRDKLVTEHQKNNLPRPTEEEQLAALPPPTPEVQQIQITSADGRKRTVHAVAPTPPAHVYQVPVTRADGSIFYVRQFARGPSTYQRDIARLRGVCDGH